MGGWMETLPLRLWYRLQIGAHLSVVQRQRKGKTRDCYPGFSQHSNFKNFLRRCVSLSRCPARPRLVLRRHPLTGQETGPRSPEDFWQNIRHIRSERRNTETCTNTETLKTAQATPPFPSSSRTIFGCSRRAEQCLSIYRCYSSLSLPYFPSLSVTPGFAHVWVFSNQP